MRLETQSPRKTDVYVGPDLVLLPPLTVDFNIVSFPLAAEASGQRIAQERVSPARPAYHSIQVARKKQ